MPTAQKAKTIEQTKEWYSKSLGVLFSDYRGLTMKQIQELRADIRKKGGELHVVKNTLFRQAAGSDVENMPYELHNGPTAITFVFSNESECAKALVEYAKTNKQLSIKGGYLAGKAFDKKEIESLAELPPRDVLIAQVIGAIAAPLTSLVGVIEALYADPIRVIGAVADKVAESSPAPAAPKAAAPEAKVEAKEEAPAPVAEEPQAAEPAAEPTNSEAEAAPAEEPEAPTETETPTE